MLYIHVFAQKAECKYLCPAGACTAYKNIHKYVSINIVVYSLLHDCILQNIDCNFFFSPSETTLTIKNDSYTLSYAHLYSYTLRKDNVLVIYYRFFI